jgi:hypothetical protein
MAVIDNLVSSWSMEQASSANATDDHGSNTLTAVGTPASVGGRVGNAIEFLTGDAFTLADNASLSLGSDTAFMIVVWFYLNSAATSGQAVFVKENAAGPGATSPYYLWFNGSSGHISFTVGNGTTSATVVDTTYESTTWPTATWMCVKAWHDPTADKIYLQFNNGTPNETAWSGGTYDDGGTFRIGKDVNWTGDSNFRLDQILFFKGGILDSTQRTWLYNSGAGRSYADIVAEAGGGGNRRRRMILCGSR